MSGAEQPGGTHRLTRLSAGTGRGFERHAVSLPCRISFTVQHMRGVQTMFALVSNLSRSGVLLVAQRAVGDLPYVAIEFTPGAPPDPAVVRRRQDNQLGCEFLTPLTARRLAELVHISVERAKERT